MLFSYQYQLTHTQCCMSENAHLTQNDCETDNDTHAAHSSAAEANQSKAVMHIKASMLNFISP